MLAALLAVGLAAALAGCGALQIEGLQDGWMDPTMSSQYVVSIHPEGYIFPPDAELLDMRDSTGRHLTCGMPTVADAVDEGKRSVGEVDPWQLLSRLDDVCMYKVEGWWTYEMCFRKRMRQFHEENGVLMSEYLLGQYVEGEGRESGIQGEAEPLGGGQVKAESRVYVSQQYVEGEVCDLTGRPRRTEVRFLCGEEDATLTVKEGPSCEYTVHVFTPVLCPHPLFKPKSSLTMIACAPKSSDGGETTDQAASPDQDGADVEVEH